MTRRLVELNPSWISALERIGVGIRFDNPRGVGTVRVLFSNPLDGGPPLPNDEHYPSNNAGVRWLRLGETFDQLTVRPSIKEDDDGGWHGRVTAGEVTNC